jgi:hypothetical protein
MPNVVTPRPLPPPVDNYAPTERLFTNNSAIGGDAEAPVAGDNDDSMYSYMVRAMIDDAMSFEESTLAPARDENLRYFYAEEPEPEGEGTSTAVSTDFRDTVMAIIPSLIRIFTSPEHVVNCHPNYEGQEDAAKQCTDYLQYMFYEDNPGFLILHDLLKDALRCKIGVVKWWTDIDEEVTEQTYRNITQEQLQMLIYENPTVEILNIVPDTSSSAQPPMPPNMEMPPNVSSGPDIPEQLPPEAGGMPQQGVQAPEMDPTGMGPPPEHVLKEVKIRFVKSKPITNIESVPLDEFRIDRKAKSVEKARLIGHDQIVNIGELVEAGYDKELLEQYAGADFNTASTDRIFRNSGIDEADVLDQENVRYGCYFIRIDKDGDGIPELREIHTIGDNHQIIHDEVVQYANYSVWSPDPEPHTLVGDSPAELVKDIQVIKTNMLRGSLDSLAQSIWPRTVFNETLVDADDILNDEIGAAIRTRGDPQSTVMSIAHQFVGQPVFQMFEVMEVLRQQRTGISDASKGVDPKALQSTALQGVDAIVTGAQERIELCARILAETGLKPLFKGLLRECVNNPNQERTIQLRGKWTKIDPSTFDPDMRISVNPTLGKGSDMTRLMVLQDVKATQTAIMQQFGVDNPMCGPVEFRNTIIDMLAIGNIKNVDRYYKQLDQATLDAIAAAPKEPDPALMLAQAELEKTKAKTVTDIAKQEFANIKQKSDDDFRRDELRVNSILDAKEIEAKYLIDINELQLEAMNMANTAANNAESNAISADKNAVSRESNQMSAANSMLDREQASANPE